MMSVKVDKKEFNMGLISKILDNCERKICNFN